MPDLPRYDLENRTYCFARDCRDFTRQLPKSIESFEYAKQLVRSSGSQAANYIEANEALSKKDFAHRIKICIKETRESALWLMLCNSGGNQLLENQKQRLLRESTELRKIFGAIFMKTR